MKGTMSNPYTLEQVEVIIRRVCAEEGIPQYADDLVEALCHPGRGVTAKVAKIEDGTFCVIIQSRVILRMTDEDAALKFVRILLSKLMPNQTLIEHGNIIHK